MQITTVLLQENEKDPALHKSANSWIYIEIILDQDCCEIF